MRTVRRSALVPYSAQQMFALVDDVEAYPEFLPWCNDAEVHDRRDDVVEATVELHRGSISKHFRTRNRNVPGESIDISLVGGPFKHLAGGWEFRQLGESGCKVSLNLDFEFESRAVDLMIGSFFEDICNSLVDAFTRRAATIYGGAGT